MAVWGGGAVMARALVRLRGLGWWSLLFLGLALSLAEEFLIQQTSVAPMVIRLKGETWARALDINYVYLIWALAYESVWVVLMPTLATELIFPDRRKEPWLNRAGAIATGLLFLFGCFFAWFTWTQIARTKVFHQPPFTPPLHWVLVAAVAIAVLIFAALRMPKQPPSRSWRPPWPWLLGIIAAVWAVLWFGLVVLAFGLAPHLPAVGVAIGAVAIVLLLLIFVPRWAAHAGWSRKHEYAVLAGALSASMLVSFVGFIGSLNRDFWFKVIIDAAAFVWLVWLGRRVLRRS
jgi:hypothetical protein